MTADARKKALTVSPWVYVFLIGTLALAYILSASAASAQTNEPITVSPESQTCLTLTAGGTYTVFATTTRPTIDTALFVNLWYSPAGIVGEDWEWAQAFNGSSDLPVYLALYRNSVRENLLPIAEHQTYGRTHHEISYAGFHEEVATSTQWKVMLTARGSLVSSHTHVCMLITIASNVTGVHEIPIIQDNQGKRTTIPLTVTSGSATAANTMILMGAYTSGTASLNAGAAYANGPGGTADGQIPSGWASGIGSSSLTVSQGSYATCSASSVRPHLFQRWYGPSDVMATSVTYATLAPYSGDACGDIIQVLLTSDPGARGPFWLTPGLSGDIGGLPYTNDLAGRLSQLWDVITGYFPFNYTLGVASVFIEYTATSTEVLQPITLVIDGHSVVDASVNLTQTLNAAPFSVEQGYARKISTYGLWVLFGYAVYKLTK